MVHKLTKKQFRTTEHEQRNTNDERQSGVYYRRDIWTSVLSKKLVKEKQRVITQITHKIQRPDGQLNFPTVESTLSLTK